MGSVDEPTEVNVDKAQFTRFDSRRQLEAVSHVQLIVGGNAVTTSITVWDLGVTVDAQLSMKSHDGVALTAVSISFVSCAQFADLCDRCFIHSTLVCALIASHIDYCNAVLYEVTDTVIRRLYNHAVLSFTPRRD